MKSKRLEARIGPNLPYAIIYIDASRPKSSRWTIEVWSGDVCRRTPVKSFRRADRATVEGVLARLEQRIPTLNDEVAA